MSLIIEISSSITFKMYTTNLILTEYFKQNQISLMLYSRNIAIGNSDLDISDLIIDELNKKLPSIKLN